VKLAQPLLINYKTKQNMATLMSVHPHFQEKSWCRNLLEGCTLFSKSWASDKGKGLSCPEQIMKSSMTPSPPIHRTLF